VVIPQGELWGQSFVVFVRVGFVSKMVRNGSGDGLLRCSGRQSRTLIEHRAAS
jgi:hypothetical protein